MVKRLCLRKLGLKRVPTSFALLVKTMKTRKSESGAQGRSRLRSKQPPAWQHHRSKEMWRQLGPDGQAPYNATSKQLLAELHTRASKLNKKRQKDCDRDAGIESESSDVEGAGSTALQPVSSQQGLSTLMLCVLCKRMRLALA